jgi:clusterin-associated protein 1
VQDNVASLEKQVTDLQADQRNLDRKLKKAQQELERGEKRLTSLQTVRCGVACALRGGVCCWRL